MPEQPIPTTPSVKEDECIVDGKEDECIVANKKDKEDEDSTSIVDDQVVVTGEGDGRKSLLKELYDYYVERPSQVSSQKKEGNARGCDDHGFACV